MPDANAHATRANTLIVVAPDYPGALTDYAHEAGVPAHRLRRVRDRHDLRGCSPDQIIVLPEWRLNRSAGVVQGIEQELAFLETTVPPRTRIADSVLPRGIDAQVDASDALHDWWGALSDAQRATVRRTADLHAPRVSA